MTPRAAPNTPSSRLTNSRAGGARNSRGARVWENTRTAHPTSSSSDSPARVVAGRSARCRRGRARIDRHGVNSTRPSGWTSAQVSTTPAPACGASRLRTSPARAALASPAPSPASAKAPSWRASPSRRSAPVHRRSMAAADRYSTRLHAGSTKLTAEMEPKVRAAVRLPVRQAKANRGQRRGSLRISAARASALAIQMGAKRPWSCGKTRHNRAAEK